MKSILCNALSEEIEDPEDLSKKLEKIDSLNSPWKQFDELRKSLGRLKYEKEIIAALNPPQLKTPNIYYQIWKLNPAGIVDFNLDKLAINSFSELYQKGIDYATRTEPHKFKNYPLTYEKYVFYPHGIVSDSNSWVLTSGDRYQAYKDSDFLKIISTLFNSKNLLIIGFNPNEWSFLELLRNIGINGRLNGYHNYYLCPDLSDRNRIKLGDFGISAISYTPSDSSHNELNQLLDAMLAYQSVDDILPTVYTGQKYTEADVPSAEDCYKCSIEQLRNILNGVIANIIPSDQSPTEDQIKKLEAFYNTYIVQLHRAWLVDPRSKDTNHVYSYKANRFIGNGAFGSVFEAEDLNGNRYALKVLLPDVKDKISYLSCFRRGIRSMRILTEKNIPGMVRIHDSYEVPACIVMDLVDGITLREAVDKKYLTRIDIKLALLQKIAFIIHQAHQLEERILHRDLKPENIMLEYCYSAIDFDDASNIPTVKILDFDLSWHRGATEKTVMFGAISQGFMAPEQTDVQTDKSLSRNTAVDVYSLGMLAYYVLTGNNPMPNESLFGGFKERMLNEIQECEKFSWKCLPYYLSDTIFRSTNRIQTERISLDTFTGNLRVAIEMYLHQTISSTHPLVLLELRKRIDNLGNEEVSDFGRSISIDYPTLSKRVTLSMTSNNFNVNLNVSIERYMSSFDQREGIAKYFKAMKERASAQVDKTLFKDISSENTNTSITIRMSARLTDTVSLESIDALADNIREVRHALDN